MGRINDISDGRQPVEKTGRVINCFENIGDETQVAAYNHEAIKPTVRNL